MLSITSVTSVVFQTEWVDLITYLISRACTTNIALINHPTLSTGIFFSSYDTDEERGSSLDREEYQDDDPRYVRMSNLRIGITLRHLYCI